MAGNNLYTISLECGHFITVHHKPTTWVKRLYCITCKVFRLIQSVAPTSG